MLLQILIEEISEVFQKYGLDKDLATIKFSHRPDLSDFQCNGALKAAKVLNRSAIDIAHDMQSALETSSFFSRVTVDGPGFVNLTLSDEFIGGKIVEKTTAHKSPQTPMKIFIDYGGPNVAKPLHVGHLRSAIIGESIKRIAREIGHEVVSDIHLGDWGTPIGMLIEEVRTQHPTWPYFNNNFIEATETDKQPPLTSADLCDLYPQAAKKFKNDEVFAERARKATAELQANHAGYRKLWKHFLTLSKQSIKSDFDALNVTFDLWRGESDANKDIDTTIAKLIRSGIASKSQGALVLEVSREKDKHKVPPLILKKQNGSVTYGTTDLITLFQRVQEFKPDRILYVVDQRQSLHFSQIFRAAEKAGIFPENCLEHIGFGTMNGRDGRPFKTRSGGVMRLGDLIHSAKELARIEAGFTQVEMPTEVTEMISQVAIAAIKFGDLCNPRTTDYIFDLHEFIKFNGKTGPYIQYAAVRASSVLKKVDNDNLGKNLSVLEKYDPVERALVMCLLEYSDALQRAFEKRMPSELCEYAFKLAKNFNNFYHECPILTAQNKKTRDFRIRITRITEDTLKKTLECLGISIPPKMIRAS